MDLTIASFDDPSAFGRSIISAQNSLHRAWIDTEGLPEYRTEDISRWSSAGWKRSARCRTEPEADAFHHPAIPIVLTALLIDSIGFGIVLPVLPGLIVDLGQVSLAEATRIAGYMLVAYAGAQFFAGPVLGNLGDRFGRRPVLLFSTIAFAFDYLLMAAAPTLAWLFAGRLVAGIAGATYGPINAVLADVTPPEKRGATFGLMGAAFGLGFILGPAIGGLMAGIGTRAPFIAAAALAGLNALWIFFRLRETLPRTSAGRSAGAMRTSAARSSRSSTPAARRLC